MKIGVIGIGKMGGTIARRWSEKGHGVRVANSRGPQEVEKFADEIGADPADIYGAVEGADVVLLSMPFPAVSKLRALWSRLWTCHRLTNARLRVAWAISTALF